MQAWKMMMCLTTCMGYGKHSRHMKRLRHECMAGMGEGCLSEADGLAGAVF